MSHWYHEGKRFEPSYDEIRAGGWNGFIYNISNIATGRMYIGKKCFHTKRRGFWYESMWRSYFSSSEPLKVEMMKLGFSSYKFEILTVVQGNADALDYCEIKEMFARDVLTAKLPNGSRAYYNESIPGRFFVLFNGKMRVRHKK